MYGYIFFEIQADDPQRAQRFYANVFGWKFERQHGPINYWQIITGGNNGGLMKRPLPRPSADHGANAFVCSVEVDDFDAIAEKIWSNSGQVVLPKFAIPGKCWQGYFSDEDGNTFGIFQVDEQAK